MISAVGGQKKTSTSENRSPLVELISKLRVKAFAKQGRVEKWFRQRKQQWKIRKKQNDVFGN